MSAIRNPTPFSLFCLVLGRSLEAGEVVDGLSDEDAEAACASGVFERGVVVTESEVAEKRPVGRPKSIRGSIEVEEIVQSDRETR